MRSFADQANAFQERLNQISTALAELDGDLQAQKTAVEHLNEKIPSLEHVLTQIQALDHQCSEANLEENDFTVFSFEDLDFDLGQIKLVLAKKAAFIENQVRVQEGRQRVRDGPLLYRMIIQSPKVIGLPLIV